MESLNPPEAALAKFRRVGLRFGSATGKTFLKVVSIAQMTHRYRGDIDRTFAQAPVQLSKRFQPRLL